MLSRKYLMSFMAIVLVLMAGLATFAQTAPVRGTVTLKKQDGTETPVSGAVVEVYRTDAKGKLPSAKTDKKGSFNFAGFPLGQVFALVITAPSVKTEVTPNIKGGMESVNIVVYEGDGKPLTEDEVRSALTVTPKTGGSDAPSAADVEAAKKAQAERAKLEAEYNDKKKKAADNFELVKRVLEEGRKALTDKNYDLAVAKFDEGINADPDFAGSAPVLLNNKALTLRIRGFEAYNKSKADAANKATLMETAKKDFTDSIAASQKALDILNAATTTDANEQKNYASGKFSASANIVEVYRLLIATKADPTKTKEAVDALTAYEAIETDAAQKVKTQVLLANALRLAGNSADALVIYKKVLVSAPDNADAMGGLGLSLFNEGVSATDKAQMQEGLNYMEKFTQMSPIKPEDTADTKEFKASIKDAVDYLKNTEKLTPQKIATPTTKKKT